MILKKDRHICYVWKAQIDGNILVFSMLIEGKELLATTSPPAAAAGLLREQYYMYLLFC